MLFVLSTKTRMNKVFGMGRDKNRGRTKAMPQRTIAAPTISRGRRCENCRHYNNGELAIQHYKIKRHAELDALVARVFEGGPVSAASRGMRLGANDIHSHHVGGADRQTRDFGDIDERMKALGLNYEMGDTLMRQSVLGLCLVSASGGDFVHKNYFCGTKYDPEVKVDDSKTYDETGDEARDRLGLGED
jgi:hypothetical protein